VPLPVQEQLSRGDYSAILSPMSKRRLWNRLRLDTDHGEEEARALLQKRIALVIGTVALLWLAVSVTSYVNAALFMPASLTAPGSTRAGLGHNGGMLALFVCWLFCRGGARSIRTLAWLDAGTTIGTAVVMAVIVNAVDVRFRPDLSMSMGMLGTLVMRAAVVPSNGTRTFAIGAVSTLILLAGILNLHWSIPASPDAFPAVVLATQSGTWLVFGVLVSVITSRVIYGLTAQVKEAARLGQYTLERKIGQGAMGVVYLARHALLRRPTAIKLLAGTAPGERALERFEREVQTTAALRHPHTVAIYDYGRTPEGVFYYAMEYLDGIDLEQLLRDDGPMPEGRVVNILLQVTGALEEAHGAGLIHRDIKPSNIMLCEYGRQVDFAKVLDFGLVRDASAPEAGHSTSQVLTGTPLYMSPEAINASATIDPRSDIYALGALAYALLTGAPPFTGNTAVEVCAHHLHSKVVPPSQRLPHALTPALESLVLDCLHKLREERPASVAVVAERLAACPVPAWTEEYARTWWSQRGATLRAARCSGAAGSSDRVGATVAVDLAERAQGA